MEFFIYHVVKDVPMKEFLVSSPVAVAGALISYRLFIPMNVLQVYVGNLPIDDIRSRCELAAANV